MVLQTTWFVLIFVLLVGYAILDGFDLGVGILHLGVCRGDHQRRVALNAIGPVWDGNEVWLLTGGGALFAAFPPVYATVFSSFYTALMLLLAALIMRAVSLEFRSKIVSPAWRQTWDVVFSVGSFLSALLLSVAYANVVMGLPLDAAGEYQGSFLGLLNPYGLIGGLLGVAMLTGQGAIYLALKSDGELRARCLTAAKAFCGITLVLSIVGVAATTYFAPAILSGITGKPIQLVLAALGVAAAVALPVSLLRGAVGQAFIASSALIASALGVPAAGMFPNLVPSRLEQASSLTVMNSSSTQGTLMAMFLIAAVGVPIVLVYTGVIYYVFKGKAVVTEEGY